MSNLPSHVHLQATWREDALLEEFLKEARLRKRMTHKATLKLLHSTFPQYNGFSEEALKKKIAYFGLHRRANQCSDEDLKSAIREIWRHKGEHAIGVRVMYTMINENGLTVTRQRVADALREMQPDAVNKRKPYYCSGPNVLWWADGNENLSCFDIHIYTIMDVYSRNILLLFALQGNSKPINFGRMYVDLIKRCYVVPQRIRFDKGDIVDEIQSTALREMGVDQSDLETPCNCVHYPSINQKMRRFWQNLKINILEQYIGYFSYLLQQKLFKRNIIDERQLLTAVFLPFIQRDLNRYKEVHNNHPSLKGAPPCVIYSYPELNNTKDFGINLNKTTINAVENIISSRTGVVDCPLSAIKTHSDIRTQVIKHFDKLSFKEMTPGEVTTQYERLV